MEVVSNRVADVHALNQYGFSNLQIDFNQANQAKDLNIFQALVFEYSSSAAIELFFYNDINMTNGTEFRCVLPATVGVTTHVCILNTDFLQPAWVTGPQIKDLFSELSNAKGFGIRFPVGYNVAQLHSIVLNP
jgi:hypothetical protein